MLFWALLAFGQINIKPLIDVAGPFAALEDGEIEPRVEIEQQVLEPDPPGAAPIGKQVGHALALPGTESCPGLGSSSTKRFS